ncbi:MAG: hypothetical protein K8S99_04460 [Planctomycetes bacterium]|nr:hypothetical protein [Planctomycetota bacterium]
MTPQEHACEIAQQLLDGDISLIDACRNIQRPLDELGLRADRDFKAFILIDSEADVYPHGTERQYWNKDVLAERDRELLDFERDYRPAAKEACRAVLLRFAKNT